MRKEAGIGAAALLAIATFVGVSSQQGNKGSHGVTDIGGRDAGGAAVQGASNDDFTSGPCQDLEEKLQTFFVVSPSSIAAPESCYEGVRGKKHFASTELLNHTNSLRFLIAIVPDPLHTHFTLSFDRLMEAVQQGATDEGYFYDSSWLPWETEEQSWDRIADADKADDRKKAREAQPGVLLFRKGVSARPYEDGLVVFVVAEEPTSGVHKQQFENAVHWITKLEERAQGSTGQRQPPRMKILGPTFSGSLPSLAELLLEQTLSGEIRTSGGDDLAIYSGSITSREVAEEFVNALTPGHTPTFRSFQESDDIMIDRYRSYLKNLGVSASQLAILSEDETTYGALRPDDRYPLCGKESDYTSPVCLYYPRDISALREAYQKQSIFKTGTSGQPDASSRRTLNTDIADPEGKQHDTIRNYGANQTPLSQEAVLQQLVTLLEAHDSQYLVLRSSNPMDQLFLSHFLRLAYPKGRIVIQGADLLMRRESGAATLSGIMTLTTYPLLPGENHWTYVGRDNAHSHRVFTQDLAEGTYIASRFLLDPNAQNRCDLQQKNPELHSPFFLPVNTACLHIQDYAPPFWAVLREDVTSADHVALRPATFLSVLGRDGFWPVAALDGLNIPRVPCLDSLLPDRDTLEPRCTPADPLSGGCVVTQPEFQWVQDLPNRFRRSGRSMWKTTTLLFGSGSEAYAPVEHPWAPMPRSMRVFLFFVFLWILFHLYCCARPSLTCKPSYRAHFAPLPGKAHLVLIVCGSAIVASVPILLGWGYGVMSPTGEPVANAWLYRAFIPITWLLGACAVGANARFGCAVDPTPRSLIRWQFLWYCAATGSVFCLIAFFLEGSLNRTNRFPTYLRSMTLTNGVSPLVPLLAIAAGFYSWFWYSLQGLGLLRADRPLVPCQGDLAAPTPDGEPNHFLSMFSREKVSDPIERTSQPLAPKLLYAALIIMAGLSLVSTFLSGGLPLRSLGSESYSILFCTGLGVCASVMLATAWQLLDIWLRLRQLLIFLDRTPLRRTMKALKCYSWGNVWAMGGSVLDLRYKLLSRQIESLTHLKNLWPNENSANQPAWHARVASTAAPQEVFVKWYSKNWNDCKAANLVDLRGFQEAVAETVGHLLGQTLVKEWRREKESLIVGVLAKKDGSADEDKSAANEQIPTAPEYLRSAEELVCLTYLGFIQNVLGRMRTLVMIIVWLFVAVTASLASYPFDPRPAASFAMLVLFLVLGSVIAVVYAQMHRDATLSNVTDTVPGELGVEFWLKLAGFAAGPVLGLVATSFPELTGSLFSWLQPGLDSIK